jgi:hypothetical protein
MYAFKQARVCVCVCVCIHSQAALPSVAASAAGSRPAGYLRAEEPEDNIMRTRTYDLYITYDQVCARALL